MARLRNTSPLIAPHGAQAVFFIALSVVLMFVDHRFTYLEPARAALSTLAYPLHTLVQLPRSTALGVSETLRSRAQMRDELQRLRRERLLLNAQLQRLTALETENRRLRLLLQSSASIPEEVLIAELLSVDLSPYRQRILLNKGSKHGVLRGQPLLTQGGVVGQVVRAGPLSASAILISDANHATPVQIDRTGLRALARGGGTAGALELAHLPNYSDVREGDTVSTSGLGGRFPPGYPVARISTVEHDPGRPFARITATPTAELERMRELLVLIRPAPGALADLNSDTNTDTDTDTDTASSFAAGADDDSELFAP